MIIRCYTPNDLPIVLVIAESLPDYFTPVALTEIENDLGSPDVNCLVAELPPVRGFLVYRFSDRGPLSPVEGEILWLGVHPNSQSSGIGSSLMKKFLTLAVASRVSKIIVATLASTVNFKPFEATRRFYEKFGFRETRIDKDHYGPGDDRAIMEKALVS